MKISTKSPDNGMEYLHAPDVSSVRQSEPPRSGQSRTGYGPKVPTSHELQIEGRWHRVYAMIYSNSGSAYVLVKGKRILLGTFDPRDHDKQLGEVKKTIKRRWR